MKTINLLKTIGIHLMVVIIVQSCGIAQKAALSCPEVTKNKRSSKVALNIKKQHRKILAITKRETNRNVSLNTRAIPSKKLQKKRTNTMDVTNSNILNISSDYPVRITVTDKIEFNHILIASVENPIIHIEKNYNNVLRNNDNHIPPVNRYGKPDNAISKDSNGIKDIYVSAFTNPLPQETEPKKLEGLGLAGFLTGLVGLFIIGIPAGIVAIVLGAISFGRIKKYPGRFSGKGFAIASMILGIVDIVGLVILFAIA